jgi:hypothetical protein
VAETKEFGEKMIFPNRVGEGESAKDMRVDLGSRAVAKPILFEQVCREPGAQQC